MEKETILSFRLTQVHHKYIQKQVLVHVVAVEVNRQIGSWVLSINVREPIVVRKPFKISLTQYLVSNL